MAFQYHRRDNKDWDKRASQQGGEFESYVKDEYKTYAVKTGNNWVRILPPTDRDAQHYGEDVWIHYNVGPDKATVLCPAKMANQKCPLCEARAQFERRGDDESAKELKPNRRVLAWILDRQKEDEGPLLWPMSWTVDRDICKIAQDPVTREVFPIDDPDEGHDVYFDKAGEKILTKYSGFQLAKRKSSVKDTHLDYIMKHPILDTLLVRDYNELKALYEGEASQSDTRSRDTGGRDDRERPRDDRRRDDDRERAPPREPDRYRDQDDRSAERRRDDDRERERPRDDDRERERPRDDDRRRDDDRDRGGSRDERERERPRDPEPEPARRGRPQLNREEEDPSLARDREHLARDGREAPSAGRDADRGDDRRRDPEPRESSVSGADRASGLRARFAPKS